MKTIHQAYLKSILNYDEITGHFTWLKKPNPFANSVKIGCRAGFNDGGYIRIGINNKEYGAHRLAWFYKFGYWPTVIDHIDGNRENNSISNLRNVDIHTNNKNRGSGHRNKTGICGVYYRKRRGVWGFEASIGHNGKTYHLYRGPDFFEACCARKSAENKLGFHENHGT